MIVHHIATEQVAVAASEVTLTTAKIDTAVGGKYQVIYADIDVQDDAVYVTFDGSTTPSATAGEKWYKSQKYRVWGRESLANLQFIQVTGAAVLEVNYWGEK